MNYINVEQVKDLPELRMPQGYADMLHRDQESEDEIILKDEEDFSGASDIIGYTNER